jgi:D-alanyl-D-alanine carboxypeptidase
MTSRTAKIVRTALVGAIAAALVGASTAATVAAPQALTSSQSAAAEPFTRPAAGDLGRAADAVLAAGATGFASRVDDGRQVSTLTRGVADRATARKMASGNEFQIGSNTKTFVATVALQLVGEGRLKLDDPVRRWFPQVRDADRITVRMLLQHTSGLFDYLADPEMAEQVLAGSRHRWTPEELLTVAMKHPVNAEPGAGWSYSNTNYVLAGMILRKVTGTDPAQLIHQRIVVPLGLRHTYWAPDARFHGRHLHGYFRTQPGGRQYTDVSDAPLHWADAAGAMISTLSDLARFEKALQSGRLLRPTQLAQMRSTVDVPGPAGWKAGYGLGISRLDTPCGTFWGHTGGTLGYLTQAWSSSDGQRSLVQVVPTGADTPAGPDEAIGSAAQTAAGAGFCEERSDHRTVQNPH